MALVANTNRSKNSRPYKAADFNPYSKTAAHIDLPSPEDIHHLTTTWPANLSSVLLDLNADGFEKGLQKAQRSMRRTANDLKRSGANLTPQCDSSIGLDWSQQLQGGS